MEPFFNMTQRVELFFSVTQRVEFFLNTTHRIELFFGMWLKELNPFFLNITQRIEPSSQKDSKNWTFFKKKILKELNFLKIFLTPRIIFCDSRDGTFSIWIQEINPFFNYYSKMIDLLFYMTHRIEPFL